MAELDPNQIPAEEVPEIAIPAVVEEVPLVIPPNRPRKVYAGMWGPFEIASVAIALMALLAAFLLYFFFVIPSNRDLARNRAEADRLDAEVVSARSKYGDITDTQTQVAKLVSSVDDFETQYLPMQTNGQAALYQRVNALIKAYGLENTTGPDFTPLETADRKEGQQDTEEEKGRAKYRSLYPGLYITTTVEGSYQNLRRFIREIETGREFVIISSVELAPSDTETKKDTDTAVAASGQVVGPGAVAQSGKGFVQPPAGIAQYQPQTRPVDKGKTRGETVALHLEMAAYFRRPNFVPMAPAQVQVEVQH
jgi:Tfp pilus assembly protein PilO